MESKNVSMAGISMVILGVLLWALLGVLAFGVKSASIFVLLLLCATGTMPLLGLLLWAHSDEIGDSGNGGGCHE